MQKLEDISKILAYQKSNHRSIQRLYDTLRFDLGGCLAQEQRIRKEIPELVKGLVELTEAIESGKLSSPLEGEAMSPPPSLPHQGREIDSPLPCWGQREGEKKAPYDRIDVSFSENLEDLLNKAEEYLREHGIDTTQDPLLQVLDAQEIIDIADSYRRKYGQIGWDQADYVVVTLAGCIGTLMDMLLVKIPGNPKFLRLLPQGYALTTWIRENAPRIREDYIAPIKKLAEAPEHQSEEEREAILAFIFAVLDIVRHTGTYVDEHGNVVVSKRLSAASEHEHTAGFVKILLRLFSEVFTSVGIQPPFGSLVQNVPIPWKDVTNYLHAHGYSLKHCFISGIVPATIDLIINGYWLLKHFDHQDNLDQIKVKLTSMLLLSHIITLSGNLVKTGVIFQLNPLTLNWRHILRCLPLVVCWMNEGIERENMIRTKLDEEWVNIYKKF